MKCRVKFYSQEIVFFREDLLYRMRRSCLMPPSTEETEDSFEHVIFSPPYIFSAELWLLTFKTWSHESNWIQISLAACCYHNPSESPLPTSAFCATDYLELWSRPLSLSQPAYGSALISHSCSFSFQITWHNATIRCENMCFIMVIRSVSSLQFVLYCTVDYQFYRDFFRETLLLFLKMIDCRNGLKICIIILLFACADSFRRQE